MIIQDAIHLEQGTDEWRMARLGHVSGSSIADVMAKGKTGEAITRKKYKTKLVAERLTGLFGESFTNASMEHGTATEPLARMNYEVSHETFIEKTGFWKHPTIKWVGVSPDGLIGDNGIIEIKCPNTTTHIDYILENKVPTEYYKQIQCQLWVTGREFCKFVSFDNRIGEKNQMFVAEARRDEDLIKIMENETLIFLDEVEEMVRRLS